MTPTPHDDSTRRPMARFERSRALARRELTEQRNRALRTVASHAQDREEFTGLLSMLGLDDGHGSMPALSHSLAGYVHRVAAAVGVPADAVGYEVSDTATAYLGLAARSFDRPGRDLMLVWDERLGWYLGVETHADEPSTAICYLGDDAVPVPAAVARFVTEAVAGRHTNGLRPVMQPSDRVTLARRMAATST